MAEIICMGNLVANVIARTVDRLPQRDELVLVDETKLLCGGNHASVATVLGRFGIDVGVIGRIGADGFGQFLTTFLESCGVDNSGVIVDDSTDTSVTIAPTRKDGEKGFLHSMGANANLCETDIDWNSPLFQAARFFHLGSLFVLPSLDGQPAARVLEMARSRGLITSVDLVWDATGQWMKLLEPCLPFIDYLFPNYAEAQALTSRTELQDIADLLLDRGVRVVAIKMGANGCYLKTTDHELHLPTFNVQALDTTAAGDAFEAGFLTGLIRGWDLERTTHFANGVGAYSVTQVGEILGTATTDEILDFMKNTEMRKRAYR